MDRKVTRYAHVNEIQLHYGYFDFNEPPWRFRLARILYSRAWISNDRPSLLFEFSISWLMQHKVLLPGLTTLTRLIAEVRERATTRLWMRLAAMPSDPQKTQLESLLTIPEGKRNSLFDDYRKGPVNVSGLEFNKTIKRFCALAEFDVHTLNVVTIPLARLKALARHSQVISAYKLVRMSEHKRIALLLAFVRATTVSLLDDALDILDLLITDIAGKAKNAGKRKRLRSLKDLDKSAISLAAVCTLILNEQTDDADLRQQIFDLVSKEQLANSINVVTRLARPSNEQFQQEMVEQYGRIKSVLPTLLTQVNFNSAPAGRNTLEAIHYFKNIVHSRKTTLDDAPTAIVSKPWRRLVYDQNGRINKKGYALCLLEKLQDGLRRRDIYVAESDRWSDPRSKLLTKQQCNQTDCKSVDHLVIR